jgi:hypothetical protein
MTGRRPVLLAVEEAGADFGFEGGSLADGALKILLAQAVERRLR